MTIAPPEAEQAAAAVKAIPDVHRQMTRYIASIDEKLDNLDFAQVQGEQLRKPADGRGRR